MDSTTSQPPPDRDRDCACDLCQGCCERSPGWLMPGEADKISKFLGITWQDLIFKFLVWTRWESRQGDVMVLAPAKFDLDPVTTESRVTAPGYEHVAGRCIFLTEDRRCSIHEVKPFECRVSFGCEPNRGNWRALIARKWKQHLKTKGEVRNAAIRGRDPDEADEEGVRGGPGREARDGAEDRGREGRQVGGDSGGDGRGPEGRPPTLRGSGPSFLKPQAKVEPHSSESFRPNPSRIHRSAGAIPNGTTEGAWVMGNNPMLVTSNTGANTMPTWQTLASPSSTTSFSAVDLKVS